VSCTPCRRFKLKIIFTFKFAVLLDFVNFHSRRRL